MKRLSKTQKEIEELAKNVPQLTDKQFERAKALFTYFVNVRQGTTFVRCPDCGAMIDLTMVQHDKGKWHDSYNVSCPCCHSNLNVHTLSDSVGGKVKRVNHQDDFFQVMNVVGDWQVTRLFYMQRYCYVRKPSTDWEVFEVCQAWNRPDTPKTHFRSLPKKMMAGYYFNPYSLWDWVAERDEDGHRKVVDGDYVWHVEPRRLEPRMAGGNNYFETDAIVHAELLPYYAQRGITLDTIKDCHKSAEWLFEGFSEKNYKPMYETLLKAREYDLFRRMTDAHEKELAEQVFTAWKIAQRNHYDTKQDEWVDLVTMLIEQGKDYRNAHYVCPADLHAAHAALLTEKRRQEEVRREREMAQWRIDHAEEIARNEEQRRVESERKLKDALQEEEDFIKRREKYFGLTIPSDKGFNIVVLQNIKEFKHEGDVLHHCVFHCAYYRKPDSLILSARDSENNPIETIEVDLKAYNILQCYGDYDEFTPYHDAIEGCVRSNMWRIKNIAENRAMVA